MLLTSLPSLHQLFVRSGSPAVLDPKVGNSLFSITCPLQLHIRAGSPGDFDSKIHISLTSIPQSPPAHRPPTQPRHLRFKGPNSVDLHALLSSISLGSPGVLD
ncbi:unnamed protein product [Prorocentrum cordatum]|uniref:Uncharacterized protein n=1 Tax=Prorocentrum cordatum TaxID=2364126 RepID=A0ABN9VWC7_9DINO|nr:unnamed protein product [Polarella glacialis]